MLSTLSLPGADPEPSVPPCAALETFSQFLLWPGLSMTRRALALRLCRGAGASSRNGGSREVERRRNLHPSTLCPLALEPGSAGPLGLAVVGPQRSCVVRAGMESDMSQTCRAGRVPSSLVLLPRIPVLQHGEVGSRGPEVP